MSSPDFKALIDRVLAGTLHGADIEQLAPDEQRSIFLNAAQRMMATNAVDAVIGVLEQLPAAGDLAEIRQYGVEVVYSEVSSHAASDAIGQSKQRDQLTRLRPLGGIATVQAVDRDFMDKLVELEKRGASRQVIASAIDDVAHGYCIRSILNDEVVDDVLRNWLQERHGDKPVIAAAVAADRLRTRLLPSVEAALHRLDSGKLSSIDAAGTREALNQSLARLKAE